jgi:anti-anti-sigma regulatory factor
MTIVLQDICGTFAENKDQAREMREELIRPALAKKKTVILDFTGVDSSTQSFVHALLSTFFQKGGEGALKWFKFKGCNKAVASLIGTVINYSLE